MPSWVLQLHQQIVDFLTSPECLEWLDLSSNRRPRRMLDYAAGNGLVTEALASHFTSAIGIDVSMAMVERYQTTAARLGRSPDKMKAVRGDLLGSGGRDDHSYEPTVTDPLLEEHELWDFDVVATSMALHHFDDPAGAIGKLARRLRPGGKIIVISWTPRDGTTPAQREYEEELRCRSQEERDEVERMMRSHQALHTLSRPNGFTRQEMTEWFENAGCIDVRWKLAEQLTLLPAIKTKSQMFFAVATRK